MIKIMRDGLNIMIKGENSAHFTDMVKIRYRPECNDILFNQDRNEDEDYFRSFIRAEIDKTEIDLKGLTVKQDVDEYGHVFEIIRVARNGF